MDSLDEFPVGTSDATRSDSKTDVLSTSQTQGDADTAQLPQAPKKQSNAFVRWLKAWAKRWFIDAFNGMAQGLFATLIIGTIIKQIGSWIGDYTSIVFFKTLGDVFKQVGVAAGVLMGAGIGAGIAHALKANKLVIFAAIVAGMLGAQSEALVAGTITGAGVGIGNPVCAYLTAIVGTELGILLTGKTKVDIIALPFVVILGGTIIAYTICPGAAWLINQIGAGIHAATKTAPFIMGIVISAVVGLLLTLPTSSAAICVSIQLGGIAGGAAVVGCAAHMVGFAVASFRENRVSGLIAQGLGTSMLQIPNLMRKPLILMPAVISSIIVGPLATCVFKLSCSPTGSGMGTAGLVGVFETISASIKAGLNGWLIATGILLLFFVIPAVVSLIVSEFMRKKGWIKYGDMKLDNV